MKCFSFDVRQVLCFAQVARIKQDAAQVSWEGFLQSRRKTFVFLSTISPDGLSGHIMQHAFGVQPGDAGSAVEAFLYAFGLSPGVNTVQHEDENGVKKALFKAFCLGFIKETDHILEAFGVQNTSGSFVNKERLRGNDSAEVLHSKALGFGFLPELAKEIERICHTGTHPGNMGHPVHYLLIMDRDQGQDEIIHLLLSALYRKRRIQRRSYHILRNWNMGNQPLEFLARAGQHCAGSALVLDFISGQEEDGEEGPDSLDVIASMEVVKQFHQDVLFVICLAPADKKNLDRIRNYLSHVPFLFMRQADLGQEAAKDYLKKLASLDGVKADNTLYSKLDPGKPGYSKLGLQAEYQDWYRDYLRRCSYPQYANLQCLLKPSEAASREAEKDCKPCEAYDTLKKMIGLKQAKSAIDRVLAAHRAKNLYETHGLTRQTPAMHMMFTGNPGTAKTTVARLYAQILKDHGVLSSGKLVEVSRSDLVGKYVGWTARLVKECFEQAEGSILFVDEAYALMSGRAGSFGEEAINAMVLEMENRRENTVVILAGYPNEMDQLLECNPGLRSRIGFHIQFEDYSPDEMSMILSMMAQERGFSLGEGVLDLVHPWFLKSSLELTSGNGRLVRNLLDKAQMKQAERLLTMSPEACTDRSVRILQAEDFEAPEILTREIQLIGFQ